MTHPGPTELQAHLLTRAELCALLEHIMYRADGSIRRELAQRMPDAYQRLTGISDASLALLISKRVEELRTAGLEHIARDATLNSGHNDHLLTRYRQELGANGADR